MIPRIRSFSSNLYLLLSISVLTAVSPPLRAMEAAQPVSPGDPRVLLIVEARCPTFSWAPTEGVESYELVVFELSGSEGSSIEVREPALETLTDTRPSLRMRLPGKASSWTPSGGNCFEAGKSYAWALQALAPGSEAEWSEAYLFAVEAPAATKEVRDALETLEQYLERGGSPTVLPIVVAAPDAPSATPRPRTTRVPIPTLDSVAITGEAAGTAAATGGVRGVSKSATGIAGVFQNTDSAGTILSGQNATDEVFKVNSSGVVTAASFVGDGSGLTGVGGGGNVVANFASSDDLVEPTVAVMTTVLQTAITAPAAGILLMSATVDVDNLAASDAVECLIQIDGTTVAGSHMFTAQDSTANANEEENCTTVAAKSVAAGVRTVTFQVLRGDAATNLTDGTLWVLWAPASP